MVGLPEQCDLIGQVRSSVRFESNITKGEKDSLIKLLVRGVFGLCRVTTFTLELFLGEGFTFEGLGKAFLCK